MPKKWKRKNKNSKKMLRKCQGTRVTKDLLGLPNHFHLFLLSPLLLPLGWRAARRLQYSSSRSRCSRCSRSSSSSGRRRGRRGGGNCWSSRSGGDSSGVVRSKRKKAGVGVLIRQVIELISKIPYCHQSCDSLFLWQFYQCLTRFGSRSICDLVPYDFLFIVCTCSHVFFITLMMRYAQCPSIFILIWLRIELMLVFQRRM